MRRIAPAARVGEKVINGGRRAAEITHGSAEERAETQAERIKAFEQIRPGCTSDSEACRNMLTLKVGNAGEITDCVVMSHVVIRTKKICDHKTGATPPKRNEHPTQSWKPKMFKPLS